MPLRRHRIQRGIAPFLSVQSLLLLHLPQGRGGGGYAFNLGGLNETLKITGKRSIRVYQVDQGNGQKSPLERHFCGKCGSMLYAWDPRWPDLVHPFASAVDTELPTPPEVTHLMLGSKAPWVEPAIGPDDKCFDEYPDESIADWHERLGLVR